ncbi:signal peptidase complex subunit 3-like [Penaeus monodon]|uniref:signal peptidase complex subunit 3-like n=1 Tax=Penaeus monodon TaxID=6687 RepID=UPI0018A7B06F|nr:signal peptidase complex subunit 3-like [Penaeus monodon]
MVVNDNDILETLYRETLKLISNRAINYETSGGYNFPFKGQNSKIRKGEKQESKETEEGNSEWQLLIFFLLFFQHEIIIIFSFINRKNVPEYAVSREKNDLGALRFDLNTDLTPLFNWNTKQLFLYLTAEYQTQNNKVNQVVFWGKIFQRGGNFVATQKPPQYYFWDTFHIERRSNYFQLFFIHSGHKNVSLYLSWNIIPIAGTLPTWSGTGAYKLAFPQITQGP